MTDPAAPTPSGIDRPVWAQGARDVLRGLDVAPVRGLDAPEVTRRRARHGPNTLRAAKRRSAWAIVVDQLRSLLVALLATAVVASFAFGEWVEGFAIVAVLVINTAIGFATELRAVRSMEALRQLAQVNARVRRAGRTEVVPARELVPGDIVVLEGGDVVTADLRLIEASKLQANESTLTGESLPVDKSAREVSPGATLAERGCMLFKGTSLTRGAGEGVVVATGMETELGHISALVDEADEAATPLEERLQRLGRALVWVTLAVAALVLVSGLIGGKDLFLIVETAIALAVAAVPEGLPIVATIALARGMRRMAKHRALVNRLSAVETLGATSVLCTDKTGTLTENRMTATIYALATGTVRVEGEGMELEGAFSLGEDVLDPLATGPLRAALDVGALCNNASIASGEPVGDPLEVALLVAAAKAGLERAALVAEWPEVREVAFDPDLKLMATVHEKGDGFVAAVKGAAEPVIEASTRVLTATGEEALDEDGRVRWLDRAQRLAAEGTRVIALALGRPESAHAEAYEDLALIGLVGLQDPPRGDVSEAIRGCRGAGVRVVMVTGDHPATARSVALATGLLDDPDAPVIAGRELADAADPGPLLAAQVFARVSPRDKLALIALHQQHGAIVAMTGDGVNDAPALKKADIGVAMGQRGTEVAREASDMILEDDALGTIVLAIREGRVIFDNIRSFVVYLLSCNISEILVIGLASAVGAPLPLLPLQILFLNLITDVFPALALGASNGTDAVMLRAPRPRDEPIVGRREWRAIGAYGLMLTATVLVAFALAFRWLGLDERSAVTVAFLSLGFGQLTHVFNLRGPDSPPFRNEITRNPSIWAAVVLCSALMLAAVYAPGLSDLLKTTRIGAEAWLLVIAASLVPALLGPLLRVRRRPAESA